MVIREDYVLLRGLITADQVLSDDLLTDLAPNAPRNKKGMKQLSSSVSTPKVLYPALKSACDTGIK